MSLLSIVKVNFHFERGGKASEHQYDFVGVSAISEANIKTVLLNNNRTRPTGAVVVIDSVENAHTQILVA